MNYIFPFLIAAAPAWAQSCPDAPDHSAALGQLIHDVQNAPDEMSARLISSEMWFYWADAPDDHAQELLDEGMGRRKSYDFDGAMIAFNALVDYCPDYAEGYNQRAYVNFLRENYREALPDLERTIQLSPKHVAALAGQALTFSALERNGEAAVALRKALVLNPWLSERHLLPALEATEQEL